MTSNITTEHFFKTDLAYKNWKSKYQYKNETELETFIRVAKASASVELPSVREYWTDQFLKAFIKYDEIDNQPIGIKAAPGGRITANAGTEYQNTTMFNCYINGAVKNATIKYTRQVDGLPPIDVEYKTPDTGDNLMNIFLTILEQAKTLASEGGWGINIGFIRPRSSIVRGIGVEHPGIVRYLEIFDKVSDIIVSGNNDGYKAPLEDLLNSIQDQYTDSEVLYSTLKSKLNKKVMSRKGAMMVCLDVSHPDIEEFIIAKQRPGYLTKFNMSVLIPDEFMEAVQRDDIWELKFNGMIHKVIKAKDLYDLIMTSTFNRAEPGVLFHTNMQKNNPFAYAGEINATNPCGEIGGNPITTTVCLLLSPNLTQYVNSDRTFNFEQYAKDIAILGRFMDNINDLQERDLDPYLWAIKNVRQYGMGLNGFGSVLYMLGIKYGSQESIDIAEKLNRIKLNTLLKTTALLAKEKGKAPAFTDEYYKTYYWTTWLDGKLDPEVKELVEKYGVRNLKQTTNPPLGNSSVIEDNVSNGLEPVFSWYYDRTYMADEYPEGMNQDNVKSLLNEKKIADVTVWEGEYDNKRYYYEPHNRGLCIIERVYDYGYSWVLENHPEDLEKDYLITTSDLSVNEHIAIQEMFQKYIDQSVSKTCNIPNSYTYEDFKELYMDAWKKGLNGFTTYREGTMESVLTKIEEKQDNLKNGADIVNEAMSGWFNTVLPNVELPDEFDNGETKVIQREGIKFYIHFSYLKEDFKQVYPFAMWIITNHEYSGEAIYVNRAIKSLENLLQVFKIDDFQIETTLEKIKKDAPNNKIAKMISMCLRHHLPIPSIVMALENLDGDNISSLLTAVRKFLSSHVEDGTIVIGKVCSNCNSSDIIFESGCSKCRSCGTSNCG